MITKRKYPIHTETTVISARVPVPLLNKLNRICRLTGRSKSDILTQILEEYNEDLFKFDTTD